MVIWLSNDVYIDANDGVCFALMRRYKRKSGKNEGSWTQKPLGYHGTLVQAAMSALNKAVLGKKGEMNTKELIDYIGKVAKQIEAACECAVDASTASTIAEAYTPEELELLTFFDDEDESDG